MTTSDPIRTLAREAAFELEEKRSRFFVRAVPVASPDEALSRLAALSDPDANHNCWAYRIGEQYRFSDDGEPGGTAGRPILAAIECAATLGEISDRMRKVFGVHQEAFAF